MTARSRGGGGKGCSELGTEIHYGRREAGKWDSLGAIITKWTSPTRRRRHELSIKVSADRRRILAGSRGTKAAVLLSPLARGPASRASARAEAAEIESTVAQMEMDHLHFLHPASRASRHALYLQGGNAPREILSTGKECGQIFRGLSGRPPRRRGKNFCAEMYAEIRSNGGSSAAFHEQLRHVDIYSPSTNVQ